MEKYKCLECGYVMEAEEVASWIEPHGETLHGCPHCFSAIVEAEPCIVCGSYELEEGLNYCKECREAVQKMFLDMLDKTFKKEEKELLEDCIEYVGEWI